MGSMCDYLVDDSLAPQVLHPIAASDLIPYGGLKDIRIQGRSTGRNLVRVTMSSVPGTAG
jgi:hypothetical protein